MKEPKAERNLSLLSPDAEKAFRAFLIEMSSIDPMTAHETIRSQERQDYLFGASRTKVKYSNHQDGVAADLHFDRAPNFPTDVIRWERAAKVAEKHGLDCGGVLWDGWDWNHFQLKEAVNEEIWGYGSFRLVEAVKEEIAGNSERWKELELEQTKLHNRNVKLRKILE